MKLYSFLTVGLFVVSSALADDHSLTRITGTQIDLKAYDHAIAGSVRDFVIFGNKDEGTFSSELTMKRDGELVRATFSKKEGYIGGVIEHGKDHAQRVTRVELVKVNTQQQTITVRVNGKDIVVQITADGFQNDHFINPKYRAVIDGEVVEFQMERGQACYGFSTHLIFMILGAYLH